MTKHCWDDGFKLLGFRSATGFAPDEYPPDLAMHGQMILEETADGCLEERLPEGTHFYTFVLYRKTFWKEYMTVVRFSETIPSARTAIGRIEDQLRLQRPSQDHALDGVKSQVAMNEALLALHRSNKKLAELTEPKADDSLDAHVRRDVESLVREKLKRAMTRVEMAVALQDVQKRLKKNPGWKRQDATQRDKVLAYILEVPDADETNMRP